MTGDRDAATAAIVATLTSSRALLGIVSRSMAGALEDMTLQQYRVLVALDGTGPARMGALAESTGVHPSTFTRMADRLEAGGWIRRDASPDSRREVLVDLTDQGRALVDEVTRKRRRAIASVLRTLAPDDRDAVRRGMEIFATAAGEPEVRDLLTLGVWPETDPSVH
jgi:DNA-binding MarR family transcriptional regulator